MIAACLVTSGDELMNRQRYLLISRLNGERNVKKVIFFVIPRRQKDLARETRCQEWGEGEGESLKNPERGEKWGFFLDIVTCSRESFSGNYTFWAATHCHTHTHAQKETAHTCSTRKKNWRLIAPSVLCCCQVVIRLFYGTILPSPSPKKATLYFNNNLGKMGGTIWVQVGLAHTRRQQQHLVIKCKLSRAGLRPRRRGEEKEEEDFDCQTLERPSVAINAFVGR